MDSQSLDDLFSARWDARNSELQQEFLRVHEEMNRRGVLNSSITVQNAHGIIVTAFHKDRALIVKTIIDLIKLSGKITKPAAVLPRAQMELEERKTLLERSLEESFSSVLDGLKNKAMIAPFRHLDEQLEGATQELSIDLHHAVDEYNKSLGENLTEQLRNQLLNNPVWAVVLISVPVAVAIIDLLRRLGMVTFGEGS